MAPVPQAQSWTVDLWPHVERSWTVGSSGPSTHARSSPQHVRLVPEPTVLIRTSWTVFPTQLATLRAPCWLRPMWPEQLAHLHLPLPHKLASSQLRTGTQTRYTHVSWILLLLLIRDLLSNFYWYLDRKWISSYSTHLKFSVYCCYSLSYIPGNVRHYQEWMEVNVISNIVVLQLVLDNNKYLHIIDGATGMAAMAIPFLWALWSPVALAIALFALCHSRNCRSTERID